MEGRILGIDYGTNRVGIAQSDMLGLTAQPLELCEKSAVMDCLAAIVAREKVVRIVVGWPISLDGTENRNTREVAEFMAALRARFGIEVVSFDERFSTREVDRMLIEEADLSRAKRKKVRDKLAATLILQGYLDVHCR